MVSEFGVAEYKQRQIADKYLEKAFRGKSPAQEKRLTIITGLPGSGKSTAAAKLTAENKNTVVIGSDDFYALYPNIFNLYKKYPSSLNTKEESAQEHSDVENFVSESFEYAIASAMGQGYNLVIDAQPNDSLLVYAEIARDLGYKVDIKFAAVPKRQLETNIVSRHVAGVYKFEQALEGKLPQTGANIPHHFSQLRVPKDYIDSVKTLLKRIKNSDTGLEVLNVMNNQVLYPAEGKTDPAAAFENELNRPLTEKEKLRQKSALSRIRLTIRRLRLRRNEWKTTERPAEKWYDAGTGHIAYYRHVVNNLER